MFDFARNLTAPRAPLLLISHSLYNVGIRCFELARVQVTANEMFKDAFDIITSEILAEQPDEYQEFVQLTREVRCDTTARL